MGSLILNSAICGPRVSTQFSSSTSKSKRFIVGILGRWLLQLLLRIREVGVCSRGRGASDSVLIYDVLRGITFISTSAWLSVCLTREGISARIRTKRLWRHYKDLQAIFHVMFGTGQIEKNEFTLRKIYLKSLP